MNSLWNDSDAQALAGDPLALRVYSSRLLGQNPDLVLHGGGNTSVKAHTKDFFGDDVHVLYVKGSGWDLATIEAAGFAPVRMEVLTRLATYDNLSDSNIVTQQRLGLLDPTAPNPSVEAILHAVIPHTYVDHTHADAVVTLTNTPNAEAIVQEVYGDDVLVVPYVMPGFTLARTVYTMTRDIDWTQIQGILLLNHGLFTFADDAKTSYETMIELVSQAEDYLEQHTQTASNNSSNLDDDHYKLIASLRQEVSRVAGKSLVACLDNSGEALNLAQHSNVNEVAARGPLTPDHVIRTKLVPLVHDTTQDPEANLNTYAANYQAYFDRHQSGQTMLDPAPRWIVLPELGSLCLGESARAATIVKDIAEHTAKSILLAEKLGGWQALPESDLFDMEYWELEQAKLKRAKTSPPFSGQVVLVTGALSGIGRACAEHFYTQGAAVVALDISPDITILSKLGFLGVVCDVTDARALQDAVQQAVTAFGGIDIVVSNAGIFPPSQRLDVLEDSHFQRSLAINLDSHRKVLQACLPYLERGIKPAVILMASKNVPAPGPGAAAYSVAKAGLTQLGRIAALELAPKGIRVNMLHPDAVYDTAFWTEETLQQRASSYGISVEQYKRKSLLGVELTSHDIALAVAALAGDSFAKTTGAQMPLDGGNNRVI
ncbi:MAG: bifunctional aldolase/short-chain dehydrogenase [Deinococcota bacterium]